MLAMPDGRRRSPHSYVLLTLALLLAGGTAACTSKDSAATESDPGAAPADVPTDTTHGEGVGDTGESDPGPPPAPAARLWERRHEVLRPQGATVTAHPSAFARLSGWATHVSGEERPEKGKRGSFGTGNGHVFAFVGVADPLNTLHSLAGPSYDKRSRFFGDYVLHLVEAGAPEAEGSPFEEEWAARSLSAPILLTRGKRGDTLLDTVDLAPWTDAPEARRCFLRFLSVRNEGEAATEALEVRVRAHHELSAAGARVIELTGERTLVTGFVGVEATASEQGLSWEPGVLEAGEEATALLAHCAYDGEPADPPELPTLDGGALLDETVDRYTTWSLSLVQVDVPDPLVADLLDGLKMTLKVQTAAGGAPCPMSEYTRTWARDNIGPSLAWLRAGAFEDQERLMDYVYGAILEAGDLKNSYAADLDLPDTAEEPDWGAMDPLSGRVAAETPSYLVRIYGEWHRHTGRAERAAAHYGLLHRALFAQAFGEDHLLPFTGDETYRAAMNAAYGLALEVAHHDISWSLNSSLLWLGASKHFARLARATGHDADAEEAETLAAVVEPDMLRRYDLGDGCLAAFIDRRDDEIWPAPFEDVQLKMTWAGAYEGDDPRAAEALTCLIERIGTEPGVVQSPLHKRYHGFAGLNRAGGVYTGMLPGYLLSALTDTGHPDAEAAFNAMGATATTSGNYCEIHVDDRACLTLVYDASGMVGDYTSRFRPWEGGINLAALLDFLVGFAPDAAAGSVTLRPHLPNDWPSMAFRGLRIGEDRLDVEVRRTETGHAVELRSRAGGDLSVVLRWDHESGAKPAVSAGGEAQPEEEIERLEHLGASSVRTAPVILKKGETLLFEIGGGV